MEDSLARVLENVLSHVERSGRATNMLNQVSNAVALARACDRKHPKLASSVFPRLDKYLKDRGDKHLVLEAAELSIAAARGARDEDVARNEAKTLICGRSWVFQRIGRLDEAEVAGSKSLELGESIPWPRNTAYCQKMSRTTLPNTSGSYDRFVAQGSPRKEYRLFG